MINSLDIPSYNLKIVGNGLNLTGSNLKGKGCHIKCNKKRIDKKQNGNGLKILE